MFAQTVYYKILGWLSLEMGRGMKKAIVKRQQHPDFPWVRLAVGMGGADSRSTAGKKNTQCRKKKSRNLHLQSPYIYCSVLLGLLIVKAHPTHVQHSQSSHMSLSCCILGTAWNVTGTETFPSSSLFLTPLCRQRCLQLSLHLTAIFETKGVFVWCLTGCFL